MFTKINFQLTQQVKVLCSGNDNYIIEDTETDTIQTQEGLAGAYQYQESANTSEQSRTSYW